MKILIIAGHGGKDPGACALGYREADLTREVARLLTEPLGKFAEVTVADTSRDMYTYLKNGGTFDFKQYNYVLEIHFNSAAYDTAGDGMTTGSEILVSSNENGITVEQAILTQLACRGLSSRGVKRSDNLLVMNKCKAQGTSHALVEVCFIDDADDMNLYQAKKQDVAVAIATGVANGFGLATPAAPHWAQKYYDALNASGVPVLETRFDDPITRGEAFKIFALVKGLGF